MARAKKAREDTEYSWMDTYGDLVTLILTFFILLFAFSSVDAEKFEMLKAAFTNTGPNVVINAMDAKDVIDVGGKLMSPTFEKRDDPRNANEPSQETPNESEGNELFPEEGDETGPSGLGGQSAQAIAISKGFDELYERINSYINDKGLGYALFAERDGDVIHIRVTARLLFKSGDAALLSEANEILDEIGAMFKESIDSIQLIRVEGHTDNRPIHNSRFEDNWDLSAKRATNTVRALNKNNGIPMELFSAMGYGEFNPIDTNETEEGRMKNRRVAFVIERKELPK